MWAWVWVSMKHVRKPAPSLPRPRLHGWFTKIAPWAFSCSITIIFLFFISTFTPTPAKPFVCWWNTALQDNSWSGSTHSQWLGTPLGTVLSPVASHTEGWGQNPVISYSSRTCGDHQLGSAGYWAVVISCRAGKDPCIFRESLSDDEGTDLLWKGTRGQNTPQQSDTVKSLGRSQALCLSWTSKLDNGYWRIAWPKSSQ